MNKTLQVTEQQFYELNVAAVQSHTGLLGEIDESRWYEAVCRILGKDVADSIRGEGLVSIEVVREVGLGKYNETLA